MHENTKAFLEAVRSSKCLNKCAADECAEAMLDEIEDAVTEVIGLRRLYRRAKREDEDQELTGRLNGYESKFGALDRDAGNLLKALEQFRKTVSDMKRADRRLTLWVEDHEFKGHSDRNDELEPATG